MYNDDYNLKICINDKKKEIFIPEKSCFLNTLVLGNKGTGKSSLILKELAYQTINNRNVGATFIVSSKDLSYELYILAKNCKRRVVFINPSVSNEVESILNSENIENNDLLNAYNFEKYIYNNYIVIIDVENVKTYKKGCRLVEVLLDNFKQSMCKTEVTCSRPHFLYVDDAFYYIDSLKDILYYGSEYNIASTLFFQNRNQFKTEFNDYTSFLDSNIGNIILTNSLTHVDSKYYGEILDINLSAFCKSRGKIFYELRNKDGARFSGTGEVKENTEFNDIVYEELYSVKRALKRKKLKEKNKFTTNNIQKEDINSTDNNDINTNININTDINISADIKSYDNDKELIVETYDNYKDSEQSHDSSHNSKINILNEELNNDEIKNQFDEKQSLEVETSKDKVKSIDKEEYTLDENIFDDGKIELTFDWDDYEF